MIKTINFKEPAFKPPASNVMFSVIFYADFIAGFHMSLLPMG